MRRRKISSMAMGAMAAIAILLGCTDDDKVTGKVSLTSGTTTELYAVTNQSKDVTFTTTESWKASCDAAWLTFSPKSGEAGQNTITVSTTATNRTKTTRTAQLTIESGGAKKTVTLKQRDDYAIIDMDEWFIPAEGGSLEMKMKSNLKSEDLYAYASVGLEEWVKTGSDARTRQEYVYKFHKMTVGENPTGDVRSGMLLVAMKDADGNVMGLDTLFIYQEGKASDYVSTDFSANGQVRQLAKATAGKGIPVVIMGDGFVDTDVKNGRYDEVMGQAVENLFSEEPVKSLREYFNVWQVTTVSRSSKLDGQTAVGAMPDHQTTGIDVNARAVMEYVKKVEGVDSLHALAVVIPNTSQHKGVCYLYRSSKNVDYSYAIALCPVIDSLKSEQFRLVLSHEAIGHGFGKLADEYVRSTEGSATDEDIRNLKEMHAKWEWYMNVDSEKEHDKVLWGRMIDDAEFENEKLGTYEGGYTYYKGVYRPSEESMMRSNDAPFNAPSRRIIYNKVMKLALDRTPDYEEFVAFDKAHKPTVWEYKARTRRQEGTLEWHPAPPIVVWKD